jgi:peptidoglycan/LPS O-acetylase OafA/YrhL
LLEFFGAPRLVFAVAGLISSVALSIALAFWSPMLQAHLAYSLAFGLLLYSLLGFSKSSFPSWLTHIGKVSYSSYLWHWMWLTLLIHVVGVGFVNYLPASQYAAFVLVFTILCGLTLAAASVTYKLVEEPGMRLGRRLAAVYGASSSRVAGSSVTAAAPQPQSS